MAGEKILIVEDNRMNMDLAVDLLELAGFNVVQAETAEKGIALAKAELPDIILMDIALPGMDGLTAARIINDMCFKKLGESSRANSYTFSSNESKIVNLFEIF